jgi:PKD repeat protein
LSIVTAFGLVTGLASVVAAAPATVGQRTADVPTADGLPTVQIDGVAWSQVIVGDDVYVAGRFENARPAGAAPGSNLTPRRNMLSYNIRSGQLNTAFAPELNGQAFVVAASPDGSRVYVGGQFTQANGVTRNRIAAYNTSTGALVSTFNPSIGSVVRAIAVTEHAVYVGGDFTNVGGTIRNRLAAFSPTNGALLNWNPNADARVNALVLTPDGSNVVAGGAFATMGGQTRQGLAALDAVSGVPQRWAVNDVIYNHGKNAAITALAADGDAIYATGYVMFGAANGNLEGVISVDADTGAINWIANCHGDHYSAWSNGATVFTTSHAHYCVPVGGFFEALSANMRHALAYSTEATGTNGFDEYAGSGVYFQFEGTPSPTLINWFPQFAIGSFTGMHQAAWSITGNREYVVVGGEFPRVNSSPQQGLTRFKVPAAGERSQPPRLSGANMVPSVVPVGLGSMQVVWQTNFDRDDTALTYRLVRDNNQAAPVHTVTVDSTFWHRPTVRFTDTGLISGRSYSYRLFTYDPSGNVAIGNSVTVTVPPTWSPESEYDRQILVDGAGTYWSLGESRGRIAVDRAGHDDAIAGAGVTWGAAGSVVGHAATAARFDGTANGFASTQSAIPAPDQFTVTAWVRTTSSAGGKIFGFGNANLGASNLFDRHVYMDNAGKFWFGVHPGGTRTLNSTNAYNDGEWHQVVASLGPDGMRLSVDGQLVAERSDVTFGQRYSGYWRVGGDTLWGWPNTPSAHYLTGDLDNVAIFSTVLGDDQVRKQYLASGRTLDGERPNLAPQASFTSHVTDLAVSFDGSGSTDPDGSIVGVAWDFGDSTASTDRSPGHTYLTGGTYTVTLTVTDDDGETSTTAQDITVSAPVTDPVPDVPPPTTIPPGPLAVATDSFTRMLSNGWGTADEGGAWTLSGSSGNYWVSDGSGHITMPSPGASRSATLDTVSAGDVIMTIDASLDKPATGGGVYLSLLARRAGNSDYRALFRHQSNGTVQVVLIRNIAGTQTTLRSFAVPGLTVGAGDALRLAFEVSGTTTTTLNAKVWRVDQTEPTGWQITTTDSTAALSAPGGIGLITYASGSSDNAPIVASIDNLSASRLD